jgi:hypothetical protein
MIPIFNYSIHSLYRISFVLAIIPVAIFSEPLNPTDNGGMQSGEYVEALIRKADDLRLHDERYWHLLLHYRKGTLGGYISEADNVDFFHSPIGKKDPRAELHATLRSYFKIHSPEDNDNLHAQCRFPARLRYLKERLAIDVSMLPSKKCVVLENVYRILAPQSVSFVFASYYMNAPASMYGHTLIKVNSGQKDLLSFSVNYAANPAGLDPLRYVLYGLFGGYPGRFDFMPYHIKVREYNDIDNRDMWEYRLNLGPDEVDRLILHSFELASTAAFNYFYLDENCSYHLLSLIEIARPEIHLTDQFPLWVIPVETIRLLMKQEKLVGDILYRPSLYSELIYKLKKFSKDERSIYFELLKNPHYDNEKFQMLLENRKSEIMDAVLATYRYRTDVKNGKITNEVFRSLLTRRVQFPVSQETNLIEPVDRPPHEGHDLFTVRPGFGSGNYSPFSSFSFMLQGHDILNRDIGYATNSESIFFDARLRYYGRSDEFRVHELSLLRIQSLADYNYLSKNFSYIFDIGIKSELIKRDVATEPQSFLATAMLFNNSRDPYTRWYYAENNYGRDLEQQEKINNYLFLGYYMDRISTPESKLALYNFNSENTDTLNREMEWIYAGNFDLQFGYTFSSPYGSKLSNLHLSVLGGLSFQPSGGFAHGRRVGPEATLILTYIAKNTKWFLRGSYLGYSAGGNDNGYRVQPGFRYAIGKNLEFRVVGDIGDINRDGSISFVFAY